MEASPGWIPVAAWLLLAVALLLLAAAVVTLWRWPDRPWRWATPAFAGLAAGATYVAMPTPPADPLTFAECVRTLSPGSGSAVVERPAEIPASQADKKQPGDPEWPMVGVATGTGGQTYVRLSSELAAAAAASGVALQPVPSKGAISILKAILSPRNIGLGFVQADVLESDEIKNRHLARVVMPLYPEEIHILSRRRTVDGAGLVPKPLEHLSDLVGRRVLVSDRSDGSEYTMNRLLRLADAGADLRRTAATKYTVAMEPVHALCSVIVGNADAVGFVAGQPVGLLVNLQRLAQHPAHPLAAIHFIRLAQVDLTHRTVAGITTVFYEKAHIERGSYPWAFERPADQDGTDTLSVRALLVAFDFSSHSNDDFRRKCNAVSDVVRLLRQKDFVDRLCQAPNHQKWCELGSQGEAPGWRPNECVPEEVARMGKRR